MRKNLEKKKLSIYLISTTYLYVDRIKYINCTKGLECEFVVKYNWFISNKDLALKLYKIITCDDIVLKLFIVICNVKGCNYI